MSHAIYDCFTFFNEFELLSIRLRELDKVVDHFVIAESDVTFRGQPKPLYFRQRRKEFRDFDHKIIHVIVDDMPQSGDAWAREHHQREALRRGLAGVRDNDLVVISDADEIPRPEAISALRGKKGYFVLEMDMYQFHLNTRASEKWAKVYAVSGNLLPRIPNLSEVRTDQAASMKHFSRLSRKIEKAGWHFTYLGGAEKVRAKLRAFSHHGGHYDEMLAPGGIEKQLVNGMVVGGVNVTKFCAIDESFPTTVRKDLEYYKHIGFVKGLEDRVQELEAELFNAHLQYRRMENKYGEALGRTAALVGKAAGALAAYVDPQFAAELESGGNLIHGSKDFGVSWFGGAQAVPASPTQAIEHVVLENVVMLHQRSDPATHRDSNLGWYVAAGLVSGVPYTASCWVWIPAAFSGPAVEIVLEGFSLKRHPADLSLRDGWQRIWSSGTCPEGKKDVNIVLRAAAESAGHLYSSCWQLEVGREPNTYQPTSV
ncbi:MAG TPA: hypothetical protein VGS12_05505 [Caulobacteraceae bacterium]|nr:hypothetical protein [Caulobacteraceae bacterium]